MKYIFLLLSALSLSLTAVGQGAFKPGYFIDNSGQRIECFIKDSDKNHNPTQFEYKLTESGKVEIGTLQQVSEFEITNTNHRYKRYEVNIDRSSDELRSLSGKSEPEFVKGVHFLRVLVAGDVTLYEYRERGGIERFFVSRNDEVPEPLVYKRYYITGSTIGENKMYVSQLAGFLNCETVTFDEISKTNYHAKTLTQLFESYYACKSQPAVNYAMLKERGDFSFSVKGGVYSSEVLIRYTSMPNSDILRREIDSNFDRATGLQAAVEIEYTFPFYRKKFSVYVQPSYQQFKQEGHINKSFKPLEVDYTHFALPVGFRYTHSIKESSKVFVNAAASINKLVNESDMIKIFPQFGKDYFSHPSFSVGLGYKYQDRFSLEANYHIVKNVIAFKHADADYRWDVDMTNGVSVLLGYRIK